MEHEKPKPTLPPSIIGPIDIGRLIREIEAINETLMQLSLRKSGSEVKLPKTTSLMDQLLTHNKLNLLRESDRDILTRFLLAVREQAPAIHISFGSDPSPVFLEKLMLWLRKEISPYVLVTIGLQPNIGAGCVMRTTNKYFDLSLKQAFANKRDLLISKLIPDNIAKTIEVNNIGGAQGPV